MAAKYEDWLTRVVPASLQEKWGQALLGALGAVLDDYRDLLLQARRVMFPTYAASGAATDALVPIGNERQLERGETEADLVYAERLRTAFDAWELAGSHTALLGQLVSLGFDRTKLFVVQRSGKRTSLDVSGDLVVSNGPIWTFNAEPAQAYAQFGLVFTADQPDITYDGFTFSPKAALINRIVNKWRPAKADFMGTHVIVSGAIWGFPSTLTWGSFNWGGVSRFIPPR